MKYSCSSSIWSFYEIGENVKESKTLDDGELIKH